MMLDALFSSCCAEIEAEYARLDHKLGWRFLSGPKATLNRSAKIALITLNPGGDFDPPDHPHSSQELGSAYLVESWDGKPPGQSKLQRQVASLFSHLGRRMGIDDHASLINQSLIGHFIPFRSPSISTLERKTESIAFGEQLWTKIFDQVAPRLVITLDNISFKHIEAIIGMKHPGHRQLRKKLDTGWGKYTADIERFDSPEHSINLVRLPHLSRFGIFDRTRGQEAVSNMMNAIAEPLILA